MNLDNNFQPQLKQDIAYYGDESWIVGKENSITLTCSCGHVKMEVYRDEEDYDLAFYYYRFSVSFMARLKTAWKYLWKGEKILLEDLVLSQEEMNRLVNFIGGNTPPQESQPLKNSTSEASNTGYKGIYLSKSRKTPKYESQVVTPAGKIYIGRYDTLEEAVTAREEFIKELL